MTDPNFARSVVLLVRDSDEEGTFGLVLNRPLGLSVADGYGDQLDAARQVDSALNQGGPCHGPFTVLHASEQVGGEAVVDGVWFSAEQSQIESLLWHNARPAKYMTGYAGWAPTQLEAEIDAGAWVLTPALAEHVFELRPNLWQKLMAWLTLERKIPWQSVPDDPTVN